MSQRIALVASAAALVAAGCTVYRPPAMVADGGLPYVPVGGVAATVCVSGEPGVFNKAFAFVSDNRESVGGVREGSWFCYLAEPGRHEIRATFGVTGSVLLVNAAPGERVEILVEFMDALRLLWQVGPVEGMAIRSGGDAERPATDAAGRPFEAPLRPVAALPARAHATSVGQLCVGRQPNGLHAFMGAFAGASELPLSVFVDGQSLDTPLGRDEESCLELPNGRHRVAFADVVNGVPVDELPVDVGVEPAIHVRPFPFSAGANKDRAFGARRGGVTFRSEP